MPPRSTTAPPAAATCAGVGSPPRIARRGIRSSTGWGGIAGGWSGPVKRCRVWCSCWVRCGVGEPAGEVAAEPVQVRAAGAVADVAVGSDEIARGVVHAEPRERLPVDVVQGAGRGRAGQVVHGQDVGAAAAYAGELVGVPVARAGRTAAGGSLARPALHPARIVGRLGRCARRAAGRRPWVLAAGPGWPSWTAGLRR